jgi:epoxyqueuosine reductase
VSDRANVSGKLRASRALEEVLRGRYAEFGLCGLGFSSVKPFWFDLNHLQRRTNNGQRSTMNFTFRRPLRSTTPRSSFPFAHSIIVGYHQYSEWEPIDRDPTMAVVAAYAVQDEYAILRAKLEGVAELVRSHGFRATIVIDDNALVDKAVARRSGQGWIGRNTLFLSNRHGPFLLVGSIVTDASLESRTPVVRRSCGTCFRCVDACPTGALDGQGGLDADRCLAWLLQRPGPFPQRFRIAAGRRIYGCDACLVSCPVGRSQREHQESSASVRKQSVPHITQHSLLQILNLSDSELLERFHHFYIPQRDPDHLRRNALLALGNSEVTLAQAQETLERYCNSENPILREQASWSLGRLS